MVRTGGGFEVLDVYLKHYSAKECIKISKLMENKDQNYKEAILDILDSANASEKSKR